MNRSYPEEACYDQPREGEISMEVGILAEKTDYCLAMADRLREALTSIMSPPNPKDTKEEAKINSGPKTKLGDNLRTIRCRVDETLSILSEIKSRIEL